MSTFQKVGTAGKITFDELGSSSWKNTAGKVSPTPEEGTRSATKAVWLREGRQVIVTRDGMTGSISFLPAVDGSGNVLDSQDDYLPKVNDRWSDLKSSPTYNLICVSVKQTPYAPTSNGSEQYLYTAEFSTQPLDPVEIDFGGDFTSCKGTADHPSGFKWASDGKAVTQTIHKVSLTVKFRITKRRTSLPYDDIVARLGCVNSDEVSIPNNRGGTAVTITGTDEGNNPENAFLLFEGAKAVETTDPNGGVMWKLVYSFSAKYNWDSSTATASGWNNVFRNDTGKFELVYTGEDSDKKYLYRDIDLSVLISEEKET
jgi:hypothetical protein